MLSTLGQGDLIVYIMTISTVDSTQHNLLWTPIFPILLDIYDAIFHCTEPHKCHAE